jgi:hypothetical protein
LVEASELEVVRNLPAEDLTEYFTRCVVAGMAAGREMAQPKKS